MDKGAKFFKSYYEHQIKIEQKDSEMKVINNGQNYLFAFVKNSPQWNKERKTTSKVAQGRSPFMVPFLQEHSRTPYG